ncbi:hypothetical protein C486_15139 [Natrinema gari JCM 14663]|uniref:Transposase n=1 Tax=Natrinema gari JCM 14663 TaxID=1230459 RepID=L9YTC7_9EURY|nr:hypothetical protein C486_15139 [Natrinema gari JCM 14663]
MWSGGNTAAVDELSTQLHLAKLSPSNTVGNLDIFGVERAQSTVHHWVHKADLQPTSCRSPDHVAVDETVIRLGDEQYWLYAAVDTVSNELPHTKLEPTRNKAIASGSPRNYARNTTAMMRCFSSMETSH